MALGRVKTWIVETLTASDLNAEFNNILNNAISLISPLTGTLQANANEIQLDGDNDTSITADTDDQIDFKLGGTDRVQFIGDTQKVALTGIAVDDAKGSDIASATTTDIGAATGNFVDVTGTTTITGLGTVQAGAEREIQFDGALTLTHNATSLILPGNANIVTRAGDVARFRSLGSGNWLCTDYQPDLGGQWVKIGDTTASDDATVAFTWAGETFSSVKIFISDLVSATDDVQFYMRTSTDGGSGYDSGASDYAYANQNGATGTETSASAAQILLNEGAAGDGIGNVAGTNTYNLELNILSPSTALETNMVGFSGGVVADDGLTSFVLWGQRNAQEDVDGVQFLMSSGNITQGRFVSYGIR